MKKVLMAILMLLLMAPMAYADIVAGDNIVPNTGALTGANQGGAFYIYKGGVLQFTTFCVEDNEVFTPGQTYKVASITNEAKAGGVSGQDTATGDTLSSQSAYLYNLWTSGGIAQTAANATNLQLAIWTLEGEWSTPLTGDALTLYNQAVANANGTLYNILVMNLVDLNGGRAQDMLIQGTPIPAAVWLLGSALLGLVGIRRRRMNG
jgi:hypothetical protein